MKAEATAAVLVIAAIIIAFAYLQSNPEQGIPDGLKIKASPAASLHPSVTASEKAEIGKIPITTLALQEYSSLVDGAPPSSDKVVEGICGNGICELAESCDGCQQDCGCNEDEYCSNDNGVCYPAEHCGDNLCTKKEKAENSCCTDCGCVTSEVCNGFSNKCTAKLSTISESEAIKIVADSLAAEGLAYGVIGVFDSYFGEEAAKMVKMDCSQGIASCKYYAYIDAGGRIVAEYYSE